MEVLPMEALFFRGFGDAHIPEILEEIYLKEVYKPFLLGKRNQVIADIGANIGLFSYYAKEYGQVYAVEPAKEHQEVIEKMLEFNKISNVTLCPYAISNKTGKTKFYHTPNTTAYSLSLLHNPNNFEEVQTVTFDSFMEQNKLKYLDLLKLDCEGEEARVLTSEGFQKYKDKIGVIVGEYHAWCNMEQNQFANIFTDMGWKFNWLPNMKAAVFTAYKV